MMRYALLGVVIVGGVVALAALDMSKWSVPEEPPPTQPKVAPAPPPPALPPSSLLPPITQIPTITPPPLPETITPPPALPPMPAPIPIPAPEPAPPRKPVARPKPAPAPSPPPISLLPPQAVPAPSPTTARNDLLLARRTIQTGQLTDARELLARIQTRLVFRPVTPDQPDRFDHNAAATVVGRAIRALDDGDRDAAIQIIDNVLAETPE